MATRRQSANNAANPASATFGSTPVEGNTLKATALERSGGSAADYTISGSGWTSRISDTTEQGDANARRTHKVWTKLAGASEPTNVQVDNGTANTIQLLIEEFEHEVGEDQFEFLQVASANSGTGSTSPQTSGTTASVSGTNFLVIADAIWRTNGSDIADGAGISWSNSLADIVNVGTADANGRAISSAYKDDTTAGTYESAVSWNGTGHECNAGILVFSTVAAAGGTTVTPTTKALTTTKFAPTVTVTNHQTVTPTTKALTLSKFAPTVTASDHKTATPSTAELALSTFAPTVAITDHKTVTPTTAELTLTTFAPTVTAAGNQTVTPTTAQLVLTTFAPAVTATEDAPAPTPSASTPYFDVELAQKQRRKRKRTDLLLLLLG